MLWRMLGATHPMEAHRVDSRAIAARGPSPDVAEGVSSFLEKRAPAFPMRVSDGLPEVFPGWVEPPFECAPRASRHGRLRGSQPDRGDPRSRPPGPLRAARGGHP